MKVSCTLRQSRTAKQFVFSDILKRPGIYRVDHTDFPDCRIVVVAHTKGVPSAFFITHHGVVEALRTEDGEWHSYYFLDDGPGEVALSFE